MAKCCMCDKTLERDDAPVLAMGAAGNPRYLCDDCANLLDIATMGTDFDEIKQTIEQIGNIMADNDPDGVTYSTVSELMIDASDRAKQIKDGTYDFSQDGESDNEGYDDIPEEMLETEEDIEKDKADEEKLKKFDKFYNALIIGLGIGTALLVIWKLVEIFLL